MILLLCTIVVLRCLTTANSQIGLQLYVRHYPSGVNEGSKIFYAVNKTASTFDDTLSWCLSLGGQLPTVHNQGDVDFLAAIDSKAGGLGIWLNMKMGRPECDMKMTSNWTLTWLDGSPSNFTSNMKFDSWNDDCQNGCGFSVNCCALELISDKTFGRDPCDKTQNAQVCVLRFAAGQLPQPRTDQSENRIEKIMENKTSNIIEQLTNLLNIRLGSLKTFLTEQFSNVTYRVDEHPPALQQTSSPSEHHGVLMFIMGVMTISLISILAFVVWKKKLLNLPFHLRNLSRSPVDHTYSEVKYGGSVQSLNSA